MSSLFGKVALITDDPADKEAIAETVNEVSRWLAAPVSIVTEQAPERLVEYLESEKFSLIVFHTKNQIRLDPSQVIYALLDRLAAPVLVIPPRSPKAFDLEVLAVPISSEPIASPAATAAMALAETIRRPVDLIRVGCTSEFCACETTVLDSYTDAFHHEYLPRVGEIITSAAPWSSSSEKQWVRDTCHCCCEHIVDLIARYGRRENSLLVFEWAMELFRPDIEKIEQAINNALCKFLLVKPGARAKFVLKVGDDFYAA